MEIILSRPKYSGVLIFLSRNQYQILILTAEQPNERIWRATIQQLLINLLI